MNFVRLRRWLAAAAGALLIAGCATAGDVETTPNVTAIVGVSVVPMTDARTVLPDQTVVVRDGRIAAVGPRQSTDVPANARRVDGRGKFVIPGLADMHVHLEYLDDPDILKLFVAKGVTTVRNMDGRPYILDWRRRVAAGELVGPTIVTAGPIIDGSPPLRDDNLSVADASTAIAAVNAQADSGYDFIKVYTNLSPESYRAAIAAARQRGLPVSGHVPRRIEIAEAIASQSSIEHLTDYGDVLDSREAPEAQRWHWSKLYLAQPLDAAKMGELADDLAKSGTWTVPTLAEPERAVGTPEQIDAWGFSPEVAAVPKNARDFWIEQVRRNSARLDGEDWQVIERGHRNRLAFVLALHRGGAPLLAGTDTPNAFIVPGFSLHDELSLFVAAGLSPGDALLAATRDSARFLGQEAIWGTVQPGRRADLVILEANPLADIANIRRQSNVMLSGRWFSRSELDSMERALVDSPTN